MENPKAIQLVKLLPIAEEVEERERKVAPSTKNAQSSCVTEMMQHVWSSLLRMGLAVEDLENLSSSPTDSEEDENESDSSSENEIPMLTELQRCYHAVYRKSPGFGTTLSKTLNVLMVDSAVQVVKCIQRKYVGIVQFDSCGIE
ncbi:unnamed protein product [Sphagnum jensenii]